ncbi:MAG TPA: hypothetical protein VJ964_04505 [Balneolaceae bacterium]|nr:hypothetical protein [Balneolaceae bacterium]
MNRNKGSYPFLQNLLDDGPVSVLRTKNEEFFLEVINDSEVESRENYTAGNMQAILANLKHEPAEAIELEAAIADIEDQLMPVIKELPNHHCFSYNRTGSNFNSENSKAVSII